MGKSEYQKLSESKKKAKELLFSKSWPQEKSTKPLVVVIEPTNQQAKKVMMQTLEGFLVLPANFIVVSASEPEDPVKNPNGKISWVSPEDGRNMPKINNYLHCADMAVVFEEHQKDLENIFHNGTVIIGNEKSPLLQNYNPNEETGNSFTYDSINCWAVFMAVVRALETFKFPYDWGHIVRGLAKNI